MFQRLFAKWYFRAHANKDSAVITLPGELSGIKKVLIIIPELSAQESLPIIKFFEDRKKEISLLYHSKVTSEFTGAGYTAGGKVSVMEYFDNDTTKLHLPARSLRERLKRKEVDLVIDLTSGDDLFGPVCTRMITARYYAGTVRNFADKYYTVQLSGNTGDFVQSLALVFPQ